MNTTVCTVNIGGWKWLIFLVFLPRQPCHLTIFATHFTGLKVQTEIHVPDMHPPTIFLDQGIILKLILNTSTVFINTCKCAHYFVCDYLYTIQNKKTCRNNIRK